MRAGLTLLCLAYVLSQFFRAFLAVLSGVLEADIGTGPDALAQASGLWFLSFAAMQLPVGWALDRIGPRRTASVLLLLGGSGGAALFAMATSALHVNLAMLLIGIGCSPVLMASYYIFARQFPVAQFATLAALMLGVGSVGNLVASYPMAFAAETFGWRSSLAALAVLSAVVALGIAVLVRDPEPVEGDAKGSVLDLLKMPVLWVMFPLMFVNYVPAAGIRGLWIGPYMTDIFGISTAQVGQATLVMGVAMIAGTLCYGPLDRIFNTQKWVVFTGNLICAAGNVDADDGGLAKCAAVGGVVRCDRVLWRVLSGDHCPCPQLCASASGRTRGDVDEPLWHRRRGHDAICVGASAFRHAGTSGDAAAYVALFGFFGCLLLLGCADLPVQPGCATRITPFIRFSDGL